MPDYLLFNKESERLLYKKLNSTDFNDWLPFHQEPLSSQYWSGLSGNPITACEEQFSRIFERYNEKSGGMNALFCKQTNRLIGLAGLLVQTVDGKEELEIGYSILPEYWRQGYAFEAAEKCKLVAFENKWADSLISIIHVDNIPSKKTALKNGLYLDFSTTYKENPVHIFRIHK
ncbi:GNAT family N-acetyltransferase [uncultured Maribacter sp.]|uniref:GNAT family N-acetyltransferase n=1 Tax=uncultured Maribacter sp. TaxID=431308 RepID=UPI0030ED52B9|tara:strand:+ start:131906 stop:132427 length:522 start_codon:yes stop_codon:yes gene_type:complete